MIIEFWAFGYWRYSPGKFYVNFDNVVQFFIQSLLSKIGNLNKNPKKLKPFENNLHLESDSSNGKLYDWCSEAAYKQIVVLHEFNEGAKNHLTTWDTNLHSFSRLSQVLLV